MLTSAFEREQPYSECLFEAILSVLWLQLMNMATCQLSHKIDDACPQTKVLNTLYPT